MTGRRNAPPAGLFFERRPEPRALRGDEFAGHVRASAGAMYSTKGLYRPAIDCIMLSRNDVGFCVVGSRAIERVIGLYTR